MSSRSAARGSEAAKSIRLALRTSSIVAVSSAKPSRCLLFWPGRRARMSDAIALATVAIPPATPPTSRPAKTHPPRRLRGAAQEMMGGKVVDPCHLSVLPDAPEGWQRDQELKEALDAAQAAPEEGGSAAGHLPRPLRRGFFSAGKG